VTLVLAWVPKALVQNPMHEKVNVEFGQSGVSPRIRRDKRDSDEHRQWGEKID
jgi:hypothetical protein